MAQNVLILGSSWFHVPILFDMCYEAMGTSTFKIFKNIPVEGKPLVDQFDEYDYEIIEPGGPFQKGSGKIYFGVTGPWAKYNVFKYFSDNYSLTKCDIHNLIAADAFIARSSIMDSGILIEHQVIISSQARTGFGVSIKRGASIGHHSVIEDFAEINPGVKISGNVRVGKGVILGIGAILKDGIRIGDNSFIGMGSVVTKDIPPGVVAYGSPCKVVRKNDKNPIP